MRAFRVCAFLAILMLFGSGCFANWEQTAGTAASANLETVISGPFNEDNILKVFHFGMKMDTVEQKLNALGIFIIDETDGDYSPNFYKTIRTSGIYFYFDRKDRLYKIDMQDTITAKSLKTGDTVDKMRVLYGTEDEAHPDKYIYYKKGYLLSFNTDSGSDTINSWSLFVDIWNNPNTFSWLNVRSDSILELKGDDAIRFNEDNFKQYFQFGMSRKALEKKLRALKIRINGEQEGKGDEDKPDGIWDVWTDHAVFHFDSDNKLYWINIKGWDTAKGLKENDTVDTLLALYGKEENSDNSWSQYVYDKNGYKFSVETCFADPGGQVILAWNVFVGQKDR